MLDTADTTRIMVFDSPPFMCATEVCSSYIYASFGTFYVQIGWLFEAQWDFKLSEEFEIDDIFLRNHQFVDV